MQIIAGLGNPGAKYENNRHNVGFMAVDAIARRHDFSPWSRKFQGLVAEGMLAGRKALLLKPQTFMNLSGQSAGEALRFYKLGAGDLTVIHDELDLVPGKVRIKRGGGHGGHNGIKSLDAHCGKDYRRVRIGIGHPGPREMVMPHVMSDFTRADRQWLEPLLDAIAENAGLLAAGDDNGFMNKASLAVQGGEERPDKPAPAGRSHIPQARPKATTGQVLQPTGPLAEMLKRMFGSKD